MQMATEEMQLQVIDRRHEADDVLSLRLADPGGAPLPLSRRGRLSALHLGDNLVDNIRCATARMRATPIRSR